MPCDEAGQPVALGARLGRGGEGEVFELPGRPGLVAKVWGPARRGGKAAKLRAMMARPPDGALGLVDGLPVLTWPKGLLLERGEAVGYTMVRVRPQDFVPLHQVTSAARRNGLGGQPLTFDKLVLLGLRLAHVVATLHRFGYAVGDLNDRNVLVSRRLTPLLMDTDSFQVPDGRRVHPCTVGDALVWPPELLDVDLARRPVDRTASDDYALATLLFQLLMAGARPYQSRGSLVADLETLQAKTRAGHYPWARPKRGVLEPPAGAPSYDALPPRLRALFERAFVAGHRRPGRRPSAQDWVEALAAVRANGYRPCPREARHVVPMDRRACAWCADPNDPFTSRRVVVRPRRAAAVQAKPRPAPKGTRKAAPQLAVAPTRPPMTPMRKPRPSARSASSADRRGRTKRARTPRRRQPTRRVPWKARVLAVLTGVLLAAWWVAS